MDSTWDMLSAEERLASGKGYDRPTPREVVDSEQRCSFTNWGVGCILAEGHDGDHEPEPGELTRSLP